MNRRAHRYPEALVWGGVFTLPTAILAQHCLGAAATIAAFGGLFARFGRVRQRWAGLCALPAMLAAIAPPVPARTWPRAGPVVVRGTVTDVRNLPATGETLVFLGSGPTGIRLHCHGAPELLVGDRVRATAHLSPTVAPGLLPSLHAPASAVHRSSGPPSVPRAAMAARQALERQLLRLVPGENGPLLATLALGRGTSTSAELTQAHRATGLSHLLAVSGAHAIMLGWLLGLGGHRRNQLAAGRLRTVSALTVLFAYALITGCEPPVLRAVVAFGLGSLAIILGRPLPPASGLLPPAILTALLAPDALLGASFQLSYAAVIGLAMTGHAGHDFWQRWLWTPLRASFWATLATAPITLYWFGQLAPWTMLLTPLLAPLVGAMLLGSLIAAALGCVLPSASAPFGPVLSRLADVYTTIVRAADHLPGTPVHAFYSPPLWSLLLAAAAAVLLVERRRTRRCLAAGIALLGLPYFVPLQPPTPPRLRLFAVGHGQAALLQDSRGHQIAVDCGSLQQPLRSSRLLAQALSTRRLDVLVITHGDQDHHNGTSSLLQQVPVDLAILPRALAASPLAQVLEANRTPVHWLAPGEHFAPWPDLLVSAPNLPVTASDNDQSLWVQAAVGPSRVLLTGDAQEGGVAAAIAQGIAVPSDLLVLPHHGRPNSLGPRLLSAVHPAVCFVSADTGDGETVLGRLARGFGCDLWVTGQHGDLELLGGETPAVRAAIAARPLGRNAQRP